MNIVSSAFGHYEASGVPDEADVVVGQSFGTSTGRGSANRSLAAYIENVAGDRPILADRTLVDAFCDPGRVDEVVEGAVSNTTGTEGGSWGILLRTKQFMEDNKLESQLLVAQRFHVGRVAMQAARLEIPTVIPHDLPDVFDHKSEQWWTRNKALWVPREIIGSFVLRSRGQL
jgi:hypothetical protein